ncbi:MAG: Hsp70 family protein, partial [Cyanobacteria bacterium P01_F01_bin.42]
DEPHRPAPPANQPTIELTVGQLGDENLGMEVFFDGDRIVTRQITSGNRNVQPLNDTEEGRNIASLEPPGYPGSDRIRVQFWVDEQRSLRITVEDLVTDHILLEDQVVASLS